MKVFLAIKSMFLMSVIGVSANAQNNQAQDNLAQENQAQENPTQENPTQENNIFRSTLQSAKSQSDGTYKRIIVYNFADCNKLCNADQPKCKGSIAEQMDITKPEIICKLNDGTGDKPEFPKKPAEPFDLNRAVVELNNYRKQHGLGALKLNEKLIKAAQVHVLDMAEHGIISHKGTDGSRHGDRVQRQGYYFSIAAENVAAGQHNWDKVFKAWQDSPDHNVNLLNAEVTELGIAMAYEGDTTYQTYWGMLLASPLIIPIDESGIEEEKIGNNPPVENNAPANSGINTDTHQ